METSILNSIKKLLGMTPEYTAFDVDVVIHINSAFATLHQLGIGPEQGFEIEDESDTWDTFLGGNLKLNNVRTYVYMYVRLAFDPPATSFAINAMEKQLEELAWRINVTREHTNWTSPEPVDVSSGGVLDGGDP